MRYPILLLLLFIFQASAQSQPPALTFNHEAILVKDLQKSVTFYQDILGLPEIEDKTEQDHIRWFSMGATRELHIIEDPAFNAPPAKGIHLALTTTDLDALIDHLRDQKVYFENWPGEPDTTTTRPDGIRQIYLQDPDGYWLEINGK